MTEIRKYTLTVHSMHEEERELSAVMSLSNWKGYLLEAAENLSDLLPTGYYVTITTTQEGEDNHD